VSVELAQLANTLNQYSPSSNTNEDEDGGNNAVSSNNNNTTTKKPLQALYQLYRLQSRA
jgi:hypothetical protein